MEFIHTGSTLSINDAIGKSWYKYKQKKDAIKTAFYYLIRQQNPPKMAAIELHVRYRGRLDLDNLAFTSKFFVDQLVKNEVIVNDTRKYFKKLVIESDDTLKHGTIIFRVVECN